MNLKPLGLVATAALAGFAGGLASRYVVSDPLTSFRHAPQRATRFELVDSSGQLWGSLGFDGQRTPALILRDHNGVGRISLSVLESMPHVVLTGSDGKERFSLALPGGDEEPVIVMSDSRKPHLSMGGERDLDPRQPSALWSLLFHLDGFESGVLASLVADRGSADGPPRGRLVLRGQDGKERQLP